MPDALPIIPTHTIGSHAWPAWLFSALEAMQRGEYGPRDWLETQNDAVDLALRDQEDAGIDIVTDGEMRRIGFFTADFYSKFTGLKELPPQRKVGIPGHDQRESYEAVESLAAPHGMGLVEEYHYVRTRTAKPIKMPIPGPYTLAGRIKPGAVYKDRLEVAYALSALINAELKALVAEGVTLIQLDEPSYAVHATTPREFVDLFNQTVAGVNAKIGVHLCFGNFVGRPVAKRTYHPLFPYILDMNASQFALEFANRELSEIDLWQEFPNDKELAAGLVDVKNYYCEIAEDVAARIRTALKYVSADKLSVTPDCGFSQTARWAAQRKLKALAEGAAIVRREVAGG
ncbi:MAG: cobalamin-independent methionine synthase II family protein [Chloroflexi bacterium]|nr:cobalamin-independent methionine synthase II family protein [Chloroflexota bacterium]